MKCSECGKPVLASPCGACLSKAYEKQHNKPLPKPADFAIPGVPPSLHECQKCHGVGVHKPGCAGAADFVWHEELVPGEKHTISHFGGCPSLPMYALNPEFSHLAGQFQDKPFPVKFDATFVSDFFSHPRDRDVCGTSHEFTAPEKLGQEFERAVARAAR